MVQPVLACLGFYHNFSLLTTFPKLLHPMFPHTVFQFSLKSCRDKRQQHHNCHHGFHGPTLFGIQVSTGPEPGQDNKPIKSVQNWITVAANTVFRFFFNNGILHLYPKSGISNPQSTINIFRS